MEPDIKINKPEIDEELKITNNTTSSSLTESTSQKSSTQEEKSPAQVTPEEIVSTDIQYGVYGVGNNLIFEATTRSAAISYAERHHASAVFKQKIGLTEDKRKTCIDECLEVCWTNPALAEAEADTTISSTPVNEETKPTRNNKRAVYELCLSLYEDDRFIDSTFNMYKTASDQIKNNTFDKVAFISDMQRKVENYIATDSWKELNESYFNDHFNGLTSKDIFKASVEIANKLISRITAELI